MTRLRRLLCRHRVQSCDCRKAAHLDGTDGSYGHVWRMDLTCESCGRVRVTELFLLKPPQAIVVLPRAAA